MRSERSRISCNVWRRTVRSPLLFVVLVGSLVMVLALVLGGCGSGEETTTTLVNNPAPDQTTTTATLPSETTTTAMPPSTEATTTTVSEQTTTSSSTTTSLQGSTTTTEKLSSAETRLPDGHIKAMGFINKVWEEGGKRYISIDYAEMLTGQAAINAAVAAGDLQPGEDLPNDYYISNTNPEKRQFEVAASPALTTSTWNGEMDHPITWAQFKSFWSATPPEGTEYLRDSPWWIERDGSTVVKIDEQYLP
jgi:cytoskeletal protein RodZ